MKFHSLIVCFLVEDRGAKRRGRACFHSTKTPNSARDAAPATPPIPTPADLSCSSDPGAFCNPHGRLWGLVARCPLLSTERWRNLARTSPLHWAELDKAPAPWAPYFWKTVRGAPGAGLKCRLASGALRTKALWQSHPCRSRGLSLSHRPGIRTPPWQGCCVD